MTTECKTGKVSYPTPQAAHLALESHNDKHSGLSAYRCKVCARFHLGRNMKRINWDRNTLLRECDPHAARNRRELLDLCYREMERIGPFGFIASENTVTV
jgi:hypothetical protein